MSIPDTNTEKPRCVVVQFCDDIRFEVGNKVTLVGLYNGILFLQDLPAFIPRMAVNLTVETSANERISDLSIRIEKDDEVIIQTEKYVPQFLDAPKQVGHDEISRRSIVMQIALPPITVMAPSMLRAFVTLDGTEIVGGKLRIATTPKTNSLPVTQESA